MRTCSASGLPSWRAAQPHFPKYGVGTSLEAVAKEVGVGPGTLYRHFPTREALLAAVLQTRSEELVARREEIARLDDAGEAFRQWLRDVEEYFSAFNGLPEPLIAAARAQEPDNPLTLPCDHLVVTTDEYVRAAQRAGQARLSVTGFDLFLAAFSVAWVMGRSPTSRSAPSWPWPPGSSPSTCSRSARAFTPTWASWMPPVTPASTSRRVNTSTGGSS